MHPGIKVLIGALMTVAGFYASITFSEQLITLVLGGVGPLLVLVGAFIVWLESDEWKMKRDENKDERTNGLQEQLQNAQSMREQTTGRQKEPETRETQDQSQKSVQRDYSEVLEGTVDEAKQAISEMEEPNYDALIAAERRDKNRKTLLEWLERRRE
ncbi:MAG: hypothetical protein ABEK10_04510 [Candidatus Nanosalina sp.]